MTKANYFNTGIVSLIAVILLIIMFYSWPLTEYSLNDVILGDVNLSNIDKVNLIESIGINYALDTIFIFSWIGSWTGLFLHFKSLKIKLVSTCFGLSLLGALLDLTENAISFTLLIGNNKGMNIENSLFIHSIIREVSFWLPMVASFVLMLVIPKRNEMANLLLRFIGIIGVLFAILGMYIEFFFAIPYYWFGLWFFATTIFLFDNYRKYEIIK